MSWEPGRERVRELIDSGEVEQVTPDLTIARRMLEDAGRHLATASQAKVAAFPLPPRRARLPLPSSTRMFLLDGDTSGYCLRAGYRPVPDPDVIKARTAARETDGAAWSSQSSGVRPRLSRARGSAPWSSRTSMVRRKPALAA